MNIIKKIFSLITSFVLFFSLLGQFLPTFASSLTPQEQNIATRVVDLLEQKIDDGMWTRPFITRILQTAVRNQNIDEYIKNILLYVIDEISQDDMTNSDFIYTTPTDWSLMESDTNLSPNRGCTNYTINQPGSPYHQNNIAELLQNPDMKIIKEQPDYNSDGYNTIIIDTQKDISAHMQSFDQEQREFENLMAQANLNTQLNINKLSTSDAKIPLKNLYHRDYEEFLARYVLGVGDNCRKIGSWFDAPHSHKLNEISSHNINGRSMGIMFSRGPDIKILRSLFSKTLLIPAIEYRNGLIVFANRNQEYPHLGPWCCDVAETRKYDAYYITYDKNNIYYVNLASEATFDYTFIDNNENVFSYNDEDIDNYYAGWIIGTVKKSDGTFPRLKYIGSYKNKAENEMNFATKETKNYIDSLLYGTAQSNYFDRELEKIKTEIDKLYL